MSSKPHLYPSLRKTLGIATIALSIVGCSSKSSPIGQVMPYPQTMAVKPNVVQNGNPPDWVYFPINKPLGNTPTGITVGPDHVIWFTESKGHRLVRIDMHGRLTNHVLPNRSQPQSLTVGADGKFYMTDAGTGSILVVTTAGVVTPYKVTQDTFLQGITAGPDGNVWFAARSSINKITPAGQLTSFAVPPHPPLYPLVTGITTGPDGNIWFTEQQYNIIGRFTLSNGTITEFPAGCVPTAIADGHDSNLWFTCGTQIGRMALNGAVTLFNTQFHAWASPDGITVGSDGQLWFTSTQDDAIVSVSRTGAFTYHQPPSGIAPDPFSIVAAPDGNLWFTNLQQGVGVFVLDQLSVTPNTWTASGPGQTQVETVSESNYAGSWSATSLNKAVATVKHGPGATHFVITAVAHGQTTVRFTDTIGNSFNVSVTVN